MPNQKPRAEFLGYQETAKTIPIAIYNVIGGRLHKSTVTAKTLAAEGIEIPEDPEGLEGVFICPKESS